MKHYMFHPLKGNHQARINKRESSPIFIHSFCTLSYDRSVASSKASSPQGAI
jgi:hypothetical protein